MDRKSVVITLSGIRGGKLWMPCTMGTQEFNMSFVFDEHKPFKEHWVGLREAVLRVTNCGDFRNCTIVEATIQVSFARGNAVVSKVKELKPCKLIVDCFMDEADREELYNSMAECEEY